LNTRAISPDHLLKTAQGFGPLEYDKWSYNRSSIRGREQMLIDLHGGAQSIGGTSANKINGIWPFSPNRSGYMRSATEEFGTLPNNAPPYRYLDMPF
jgi:hypothetical protein